jgi:myo-inositol catabolism protein IolC
MKEPEQLFFRKDEGKLAIAAAKEHNEFLLEVIDKRSKKPKARMYVLTKRAAARMIQTGMMKRMWIFKLVCWPVDEEMEHGD